MTKKTVQQVSATWDLNFGGTIVRGVRFRNEWWFPSGKVALALGYRWERSITNLMRRASGFPQLAAILSGDEIAEIRAIDPSFAHEGATKCSALRDEGVCHAVWASRTDMAARLRHEGIPGLLDPGELEDKPDDAPEVTPEPEVVTSEPEAQVINHEGWSLTVRNGEPLVSDEEIARHIELDVYKLRRLVERHVQRGHIKPVEVLLAVGKTGGRPGRSYILTEHDALFVVTRSGAPRAIEMTKVMIRVFLTVRDRLAGKASNDARAVTFDETLRLILEQNSAILRQTHETVQILARRVDAIETRPSPQLVEVRRIDDVETRVGRVEADVASGVIGKEVAMREIVIPLRVLSADPLRPGKLNISQRMSYDKRLRNEVDFNGDDTRWEKLERSKLARAQLFVGRFMREADEERRRAVRNAQAAARAAQERGDAAQTVLEFDPTRKKNSASK